VKLFYCYTFDIRIKEIVPTIKYEGTRMAIIGVIWMGGPLLLSASTIPKETIIMAKIGLSMTVLLEEVIRRKNIKKQ